MAASLDSRCPSCHRQFASDSCVLRHMNHPRTSCATWFDFLRSTESISTEQSQSPRPPTGFTPFDFDNEMDDTTETASNHDTSSIAHFEDIHPNTPSSLGSGPGFMDHFNANRHAEKRRVNLYYPFTSKEEWGLASWLLCSGLSMRAIDDFLALPMVHLKIHPIYSLLNENQGQSAFTLFFNCKNAT